MKMNHFFLICLITLSFSIGQKIKAQPSGWSWAKSIGGTDNITNTGMVTDDFGNCYLTGYFFGTVDFDPGSGVFNLTSMGYGDVFMSKLDSSGNLLWAMAIGDSLQDLGLSIAVDGFGNVYAAGFYYGIPDFDPGPGVFNLSSAGYYDGFICKMDGAGNLVWAKSIGGSDGSDCTLITVDVSGEIFVAGSFIGTVDFDPGPGSFILTSTSNNHNDMYFSKFDNQGDFLWAKSIRSMSEKYFTAIIADSTGSGDIYTIGYFTDSVDMKPGPGTFNINSNGAEDIFIAKYSNSGNLVWARSVGSIAPDRGYSITMDGSGSIYAIGSFMGTVDFNPGTGVFNVSAAGNSDSFVLKLDSAGNFLWVKTIGGSGYIIGNSIRIDHSENLYLAGRFSGVIDIDPGLAFTNITSSSLNYDDIFLVKYDGSGNLLWGSSFGGTNADIGNSVCIRGSDNLFLSGNFRSATFAFGAIPLVNTDTTGLLFNVFVARLNSIAGLGFNETDNSKGGFAIFPNPACNELYIEYPGNNKNCHILFSDISGKAMNSYKGSESGKQAIDISNYPDGVYIVKIILVDSIQVRKILIMH